MVEKIYWLEEAYNPELLSVIKKLIQAEREGTDLILFESLSDTKTINLLKRLEELKILTLKNKYFSESITTSDFSPKGLMNCVIKKYLDDLSTNREPFNVSKEEYNNTIKSLNAFLKTNLFKEYFYNKIYSNIHNYYTLASLTQIPQDFLIEADFIKNPKKNVEEYKLFVEAAKNIRKNFPFGHKAQINSAINQHFFETLDNKEKLLIQTIQEELDTGLDMIPFEDVVNKMVEKKFTKEETLKLLDEIQEKGEAYKPRKNFIKLVSKVPKRWFN